MGEDANQGPATEQNAKDYGPSHGYPAGVHIVVDPNWNGMNAIVKHAGTVSLPNFVVFDGLMEIIYIGSDLVAVEQAFVALLNK